MSERLNVKNLVLEPESKPGRLSIETVREQLEPFLLDTFKNHWNYDPDHMEQAQANLKPEVILPKDIDYTARKVDTIFGKSGEYTLNLDTVTIDWENVDASKLIILDLSDMESKYLYEVANHILDTYGETHYIPGLEYWQYVLEHPNKMPKEMKEDNPTSQWGKAHFIFGSLMRDLGGAWLVPCVQWHFDRWLRYDYRLDYVWGGRCRAVLLPKEALPNPKSFTPDLTPPQPKSRNF